MPIGEYPGVKDSWIEVIASQGESLLSVDVSCSDVSDCGLDMLKECPHVETLKCNYCDEISDTGFNSLSGTSPFIISNTWFLWSNGYEH
jgi:hypothetical protein